MRSIALALAAGAILSAGAVALASGGPPPVDRGYPPPGVTAVGVGTVDVAATNRDSEARIRRAVRLATDRARPRAIADAKRKAQQIAAAAGMRLGAIWAAGQEPNVPYWGTGVEQGTFGGNRYCGRARVHVGYRINSAGRRVRRYALRHTCRAPREATVYLTVTFAQG
jgi:hypothetical protein